MRIALLGTGLLGFAMAERLLDSGIDLIVYNRTHEKALPLADKGARVASDVVEAVAGADGVILMLSDAAAVESSLLSGDGVDLRGRRVLQMGTIGPDESRRLAKVVGEKGGDYAEAPVLGSLPEAKAGKLIVMFGGTEQQLEPWRGLLSCLGGPVHVGEVGHAAAVKLALNQLIASLTAAFSLSLGLVEQEGIAVETFMAILRKSALYAPTFDKKLSRMVERNFAGPNFPTKHLAKDVALFLREGDRLGLDASGLRGVEAILQRALDAGLGDDDYSAIHRVVNPKS